MVYFVCETCNETLKKAQVDKHVFTCRNCWGVTCVDCNKTFEGDAFREHTSCLSEDQKYQGALYKAPKAKAKNRGIQEIWTDAVIRAASSAAKGEAPKDISAFLCRMGDMGNIPRQEKKFKNYIKNSLRVFNEGTAAKLWEHLEGVKDAIIEEEKSAPPAGEDVTTPPTPSETPAKKGKKRVRETDEDTGDGDDDAPSGKKHVKEGQEFHSKVADSSGRDTVEDSVDLATRKALAKAAKAVLKKVPDNKLAVKRLVKQAVTAVREKGGTAAKLDEKLLKRTLRQRLRDGLRGVTVTGTTAAYVL